MSTKGEPVKPSLSQAPIVLKYEGRRFTFVGTQEKPAWIAQDLCDILDIKNVSQALAGLDPDEKGICTTYTASGRQTLLTVYESGMYALILRSRKPEAKKFRKRPGGGRAGSEGRAQGWEGQSEGDDQSPAGRVREEGGGGALGEEGLD